MWSRTQRCSALAVLASSVAVSLALAACSSQGSSSSGTSQTSTTLKVGYYGDPSGGIDPDVFYDVEGDSLMLAMYDTLLTYRPGSTILAPNLATAWQVSPDGLTYTFTLRQGVKFHDGTPFNAAAVVKNFQRRIAVKQAVSYMVDGISTVEAPSVYVFVAHLKQRNNAFLEYMASMYGPKMVSPLALSQHAGSDNALKWMSTHEDGTGPYTLTAYQPGSEYGLSRFERYWGPRPYFSKVVISVIPDVSTAELQLRSGGLDLLTHGIANSELQSLQAAGLQVNQFPAAIRQVVLLNQSKPPFDNQQVRQAAAAAILAASTSAVPAVFGTYSKPARSAYPQIMSTNGEFAPLPQLPTAKVPAGTKIVFSFTSSEPALLQLAQFFKRALDKAGFAVTLKGDTVSQEFGYAASPGAAPNATLSTFNPDAAHPDTWARPVWYTGGGLNLFQSSDKVLDGLLDAGAKAATPALQQQLYGEAGARASADAYIIPVDDANDSVVSRADLIGLTHVPVYIWMVNFATLARR